MLRDGLLDRLRLRPPSVKNPHRQVSVATKYDEGGVGVSEGLKLKTK